MKITIRLLTVIFLSVTTFPALAQSDADRSMLRNEIEKDLTENILSFRMEMPDHPKGGVLNARILWTFSHAYGQYGLEEYRRIADNAQRELIAIKDGTKQTSILSYDIFGLSEHFRVTGEKESLDAAIGIFRTLEDNVSKGADMETHMNLLEACISLYRVWPDDEVKMCISELIDILQGHLKVVSDRQVIGTSWLLYEAAEAVAASEMTEKFGKQAVEMTDAALVGKWNGSGAIQWRSMCEIVTGYLNAWEITGDRKYFDAARNAWNQMKEHSIDTEEEDWHSTYHKGRLGFEVLESLAPKRVHTEVMAWSNITGVRMDGELVDFESTLRVGNPDGYVEKTGRERQNNVQYHREDASQIVSIPMHGAHFTQKVTDIDHQTVNLEWTAEADATSNEGAYFCITFSGDNYVDAAYRIKGSEISIMSATRSVSLKFDRKVKAFTRQEEDGTTIYVTLLPTLKKGEKSVLSAVMKTSCTRRDEKAEIALDLGKPGNSFIGFGGNFRLQNPKNDPAVISYCLDNMRVAMGRVELPWRYWHPEETMDPTTAELHPHVRQSLEMAQRLERMGMPIALACWFPPQWALEPGSVRRSGGVAALRLDPQKKEAIYRSLCSYIRFAKDRFGVEFDYFSFNESDIGIDVLHTADEHKDFIKEFGAVLASEGLPCKMFLGDNSDATTISFIKPALADPETHKYIGAVSFHSWRGCDDKTLNEWALAAESINVPLIVGEGSTDAAAHRYPQIFNESTFALYEINLYTRICAICQPLTILQWQLTSDYSPLWGNGIFRSEGPLRPTQRFWNLKQLAMTPENSFAVPAACSRRNLNIAAFANIARGETAVHIVNNGGACKAEITGLSEGASQAIVYVTNSEQNSTAKALKPSSGILALTLPAESFVTIIIK